MVRKNNELSVEIKEAMRGGPGQAELRAIASADELYNHARLFSVCKLLPGCGIGEHKHEGESEIFYIIEGEALYIDNGKEVTVSAGDVTICPSGESHGITNISGAPCTFVALIVLDN